MAKRGPVPKDLTGHRHGKLVVVRRNAKKPSYWHCRCDCGGHDRNFQTEQRLSDLRERIWSAPVELPERKALEQELRDWVKGFAVMASSD